MLATVLKNPLSKFQVQLGAANLMPRRISLHQHHMPQNHGLF